MSDFDLKPGSVVHAAIAFLRTHGSEVPITTLGRALGGRDPKRLAQSLAPARKAGLLVRRLNSEGFALWSLGKDPDESTDRAAEEGRPGDERQVVRVSAASAPSIFAYADQRGAAPFACSTYTDGRMAIERHGRLLLELTPDERMQLLKHAALTP
jgi:hypothetical protein